MEAAANGGNGYSRLASAIDASVNFSKRHPDGGMVETRFVQRIPERFIVYISSMSGCDMACRFCHLTQTGQTTSSLLSRDEMAAQAEAVLSDFIPEAARTVHFNFMARGEPLANPAVDKDLFIRLKASASTRGLQSRVKVSTIMPRGFERKSAHLWDADCPPVDIYYSLYSLEPKWRKRWMPKAMEPVDALAWLADWQKETGNRVVLHWALINGENDSDENAAAAAEEAKAHGLRFDFNLVRYNPANGKSCEAPQSRIDSYVRTMTEAVGSLGRVKVIPRVGYDVKASCGMFLAPDNC